MDVQAHERLRKRIREIIAERNQIPEKSSGGFLHLLPMAMTALPSVIEAGKKLFGSGKHKEGAKTRKPNEHAQLVKAIIAEHKAKGTPISLPQASKMAKQMREGKMEAPKPARKPRMKKQK